MRHGAAGRRSRNRGKGNRRGNQNRTYVFDSNGPDVRIRGTAHQVFDKYDALAKDAASIGDHVLAQSYLQHAEHYQRIINNWEEILENGGVDSYERSEPEFQSGDTSREDLDLPASITGSGNRAEVPRELESA